MESSSPPWSIAITVTGELDMASAPGLRDALLSYCSAATTDPVVVDLSGVTFMDLSGLRPLTEAQRLLEGEGKTLKLRGVPHAVARLLHVAGMAHVLAGMPPQEHGEHMPLQPEASRQS